MKSLVKRALRGIGLDLVKYPPLDPLDVHLRRSLRDVDLVLDVGAFNGTFCKRLRSIGYRGRIISFEPCASSFEALSATMSGDPLWDGVQCALGDEDTSTVLNTYDNGVFNSIHTLRRGPAISYRVEAWKPEDIQMKKLDSIWDDSFGSRVFLKIDTQGHDAKVIEGASGHLGSIMGTLSEIPAVEIYDGMVSMPDMIRLMQSKGFIPAGFYPVNHGLDGTVAEFDVLFLRV